MTQPPETTRRNVEPVDPESLEDRLRAVVLRLFADREVDDLELRHLTRVITECSLLLTDVYSDERISRIMDPGRAELARLVTRLIEEERSGVGEVLYRVRRLPDDVRVIGDKALFDSGLLGLRRVKGYDLEELGARAYRIAGETLELLAEDRRLRQFFKENRFLVLPLEREVDFLRQCSDRFPVYADILKRMQQFDSTLRRPVAELATRVPLMAAAAEALSDREAAEDGEAVGAGPAEPDPDYLEAVRGDSGSGSLLSRDELISAYERMVLFSSLDMERLRAALDAHVIDQREAVRALCDEFSLFAAGTRDLRKPPAYFLVGPTGVGKNHLVESLCRLLEGVWQVEVPILTIEGPNYTYPSDINELRGATRGFIRSDEEGLLSSFYERSSRAPLSVILIDEVEKAHPQLRKFFLSILDRGTTTDNRGRLLNFANAMVFFTSNLGYSDAQKKAAPIGYQDDEARVAASDVDTRRTMRRSLTPEFMNRVRIIHFDRLTRTSAERILDLELDRIARRYAEMHGLELEVAPSAREELIRQGFSPDYGARHLTAVLERVCNVEVAKKIRRDDEGRGEDRQDLVAWLRELRQRTGALDLEEVKRRVLDTTRARTGYTAVRVVFEDGNFDYRPVSEESN
jgi:MoxR-like ATPase